MRVMIGTYPRKQYQVDSRRRDSKPRFAKRQIRALVSFFKPSDVQFAAYGCKTRVTEGLERLTRVPDGFTDENPADLLREMNLVDGLGDVT